MQRALGPPSIREYQPLISIETGAFLRRLLDDPDDYISLTRRYVPLTHSPSPSPQLTN